MLPLLDDRWPSQRRVLALPGSESLDPFGFEFAEQWYDTLFEEGVLPRADALFPAASLTPDAVYFARRGLRVKLLDPDKTALRRAADEVKRAGFAVAGAFEKSLAEVKPWHLGSVGLIVDRGILAATDPGERFAYVNRVGRILPKDGFLVGIFRIGNRTGGPPHAVPLDLFQRFVLRYFHPVTFQPARIPEPGEDQAWCGVLQRK